jgi:hypothetical protein
MRLAGGMAALRSAIARDLDGTAHGIDDAGEFNQEPVAGGLDDAPAMLGDLLVAKFASDRP